MNNIKRRSLYFILVFMITIGLFTSGGIFFETRVSAKIIEIPVFDYSAITGLNKTPSGESAGNVMNMKPSDRMVFRPLDIALSPELQEHTYRECEKYGVPFPVMLAIMENESAFRWQPAKADSNGLASIGYTQINYPNWSWLREQYGLDVQNERDNISAGIVMLSMLTAKYPLEKALVTYQCGEAGGAGISSTQFSRKILDRQRAFSKDMYYVVREQPHMAI